MKPSDMDRPGVWRDLLPHALALMAHLEAQMPGATWTFGGGTVLMLRIGHRLSKDIDLFVPDPQALGWVNPRLSEVAERISTEYEEGAEFIKLFLPTGEIDIVAGATLTDQPYEVISCKGRELKLETCAEIVAKKLWHRGDRAKARDLYDLCAVAQAEPAALTVAGPWFARHGSAFLAALQERAGIARREFQEIDAIGKPLDFDLCLEQAHSIIRPFITS